MRKEKDKKHKTKMKNLNSYKHTSIHKWPFIKKNVIWIKIKRYLVLPTNLAGKKKKGPLHNGKLSGVYRHLKQLHLPARKR